MPKDRPDIDPALRTFLSLVACALALALAAAIILAVYLSIAVPA